MRIINEPTAAAIAYGLDKKDGEKHTRKKSRHDEEIIDKCSVAAYKNRREL